MTTDQHLQDFVRVTATINPTAIVPREIGRTLFLTTDDELAGSGPGRVETFSSAAAVHARFGATSEPGKAATRYFAQAGPQPFIVARWRKAAVDNRVVGVKPAGTITEIEAISSGEITFAGHDLTPDFSGDTSWANIAATLQASVRTQISSADVTYDAAGQRFIIDTGTTDGSAVTGTHAALLGLDAASGARYLPGGTAEAISNAIAAIWEIDSSWTFLIHENSIAGTADSVSLAEWANGSTPILIAESHESGALTANESTSQLANLLALESPRARVVWSSEEDYKSASIAGLLASVRFSQPGSAINLTGKTLPGCTKDSIDTAQRSELDRKGAMYYIEIGGSNAVVEPPHSSGVWIDAEHFTRWLVADIQTSVWNLIRSSRRLPLTQAGLTATRDAIAQSCERGVANGGLASGQVNNALRTQIIQTTDLFDFDGTLASGYLIWIAPLTETIRASRRPEFRVWALGSGAINRVNIDITLEQ